MLKNKKADTINWWIIIGAIIALLALIFAGLVLWRSFTSGEASTQSNMPCNPAAAEKKNCFDVVTKTYYGENGPVGASGETTSAGGMPVEKTSMQLITKVEPGPAAAGVPNEDWVHKEDIAANWGGVYKAYVTFGNTDTKNMQFDEFIVYVKEEEWDEWCVRTFKAADTEKECKNYLTIEIKKRPTKASPGIDFNLIEEYTPSTTILKPGTTYRIPRSPKEFYNVNVVGEEFGMGYYREVGDGVRFVVRKAGSDARCGIDGEGNANGRILAPLQCPDCNLADVTSEFQIKPTEIECCLGKKPCARLISKDNDFVDIQLFSSKQR